MKKVKKPKKRQSRGHGPALLLALGLGWWLFSDRMPRAEVETAEGKIVMVRDTLPELQIPEVPEYNNDPHAPVTETEEFETVGKTYIEEELFLVLTYNGECFLYNPNTTALTNLQKCPKLN